MTEEEKKAAREKGEQTRKHRYEMRMQRKMEKAEREENELRLLREHDRHFMQEAFLLAKKASSQGDIPIGCLIEYKGKVIGRGFNRRMADHMVLAHAEIIAIHQACREMGDWRLEGCTMYVTLEPCPMCAGAVIQARISRVVIGCMNPKAGCAGSVLDLFHEKGFNHRVETETGILGEECSLLIKDFFSSIREEGEGKKIVTIHGPARAVP